MSLTTETPTERETATVVIPETGLTIAEQRREERIPTPGKHAAILLDLNVAVRNHSTSGICFRFPYRTMISLDQKFEVEFDGETKRVAVRWIKKVSNSEMHVGCEFID